MRVLGIDPAMRTGFCHGEPGGQPVYSLWQIPDHDNRAERLCALEDRVRFMLKGNGITHVFFDQPYIALFEDAKGEKTVDRRQLKLLLGYENAIEQACSREGVPCAAVAPISWRVEILKVSRVKGGRDEWKKRAIAWCVSRGWNIEQDDIAEACCVWEFGCRKKDVTVAINSTPLFDLMRPAL